MLLLNKKLNNWEDGAGCKVDSEVSFLVEELRLRGVSERVDL